MMYLVHCWVEHPSLKLDQTYAYYSSKDNVVAGTRVSIPFGYQKIVGFVDSVEQYETLDAIEKTLGFSCKEIIEVIDEEPLLTEELIALAKKMAYDTISPTISCFKTVLPPKLKPTHRAKKRVMEKWVKVNGETEELTPKQKEALQWLKSKQEIQYSEFTKKFKSIPKVLLVKKAVVVYEKEKEASFSEITQISKPMQLTLEQQKAKEKILRSNHKIHLLHGVTGSGKTEVYLQLASEIIQQGKQVLILVPEISLTPQMIDRVQKRFGSAVAIYHSGLNDQEKYEQYQLVKKTEVKIVVGTRSSVFMPFQNLGLVILDEEHDSSYKQSSTPTYHCRDIALERSKYWDCKVILGSATPSLESYARAMKEVYELTELKERVNQHMPKIQCVDFKEVLRQGETSLISTELKMELEKCLNNKKQAILLLNRRGFHTALKCNGCQEVLLCQHCDIALSYHHVDKKMKCHSCSSEYELVQECPSCHQRKGFSGFGVGTQRIEMELQKLFPQARVGRMDADTTRVKNGHQKILNQFDKLELDILVGTQMIAKGLDYPNVVLVGILNADAGLNRLDYRSVESVFELIVQASGRSGRASDDGKVVLQVFNKNHYAVQCALEGNYKKFFNEEMRYRHSGQYPPYTFLISILVQGYKQEEIRNIAWGLKDKIQGNFKVLGASELIRIKELSRYRLLVKGKDIEEMKEKVSVEVRKLAQVTNATIIVDVNPIILE